MTRRELGAGVGIGVAIFLGYGLQTYELQSIDSNASAFLTALYVPIVPFLQWIAFKQRPHAMALVAAGIAFLGLVLLAGPDSFSIGLGAGEIATLLSTLPIAAEIILIGLFAGRVDLGRVTVVQLLTAGVLGFLAMPVNGEVIPAFSWYWALPIIGLAISTFIIQSTMNWAQKTVNPTRAATIYTGEPVWAGIFGRMAGERLGALAIIGAALIVFSTLVSEIKPRPRIGDLKNKE
ncbi:DMT family transporter [Glutamicibacter mysorens]|uniref:DMT family transporter n=1 Tax=Glutamicibacter mysorens TaxID=257984 RepID=UPI0020C6FF0E|nr:DMT family transporter [Glutamicibacter mysorens]UTM45748.1 DMT family transporter [Glutamicibacter mysorens]